MGCWEKGKYQEAIAAFRRALQIDPNIAEAHIGLAIGLISNGSCEEAIDSCRRALELDPDSLEARCNMGLALASLGRLGEAAATYREVLDVAPTFAEGHLQLSRLKTYTSDDQDIAAMELSLADPATSASNAMHLRKPIYKTSLGRWRRYGHHLVPLVEMLGPCARDAREIEFGDDPVNG
jgi:Flp pilus assembly protein TadD